ncbi:hypothetical protein [Anaerosinus massiliensis]|uniref:hypothetical protein n=1 Tax=Massilibacillus massiliensis TaxID=1806837 RepID=UPI000DA618B6|nr:hypothetical protein [Massilibacillus massiliensis]
MSRVKELEDMICKTFLSGDRSFAICGILKLLGDIKTVECCDCPMKVLCDEAEKIAGIGAYAKR